MAISLGEVPNRPGIYAMYGGESGARFVAYVGQAGKLRQRLNQHLVLHDSSVTTGTAVVNLNPDLVRSVSWWEHPRFDGSDVLGAAELVAFEVLEPVLRSRGRPRATSKVLRAEEKFLGEFRALFAGSPTGELLIDSLPELATRVRSLEERVEALERVVSPRDRA